MVTQPNSGVRPAGSDPSFQLLVYTSAIHFPETNETIMKKLFALLIATVILSGCNTVSGIGRDVQKVGQVVTGAGGK